MVGFGVGVLFGCAFILNERRKDKLYKLDVFHRERQAILNDVVYRTGAINAIVLKIHNSGSRLDEAKKWYSSVVAEAPTTQLVSAAKVWQNIDVDSQYKEIIRKVRREGKVFIDAEAMPQSFLKRTYIRMGVHGSLVMKVYEDEHFFYYCSFAVRNYDDLLDNIPDFNSYEVARISLMRLYEKYHEYDVLRMDWNA